MAGRRNLSAPKKIRKVAAGKSVQYIADIRHMGNEPEVKGKILDEKTLARVFSWYNYMCSRTQVREYLENFFKTHKRPDELKLLKQVPDGWLNAQVAWFARTESRGAILTEAHRARIETRIQEMFAGAGVQTQQREEPKVTENVISIQDRIHDKVSEFVAEFEKAVDAEGWTISMYQWMQNKGIPSSLANRVAEQFREVAEEAQLLISKQCDPSLKEGYNYTAAQLKQRAAFYQSILNDCARHAQNAKAQRAPRKKKAVSMDKKLKSLKFQKECAEFKIVSIDPEKIVGAQELITFNTKYKTLTQFVALGNTGLDIKGTTVLSYDEEKSKSYRIGRKTQEHLETALRGGKRAFAKMLGTLKTCTLQHRINDNTILLKV